MPTELTEEQIEKVNHDFRRCREGTAEAIISLRRTGDTALIPEILRGIVWRYVRPEAREQVEKASIETPLSALGMDSLMMLEVVLDVQDALNVTIEDADLKKMKTIGDLIGFLQKHYAEVHRAG